MFTNLVRRAAVKHPVSHMSFGPGWHNHAIVITTKLGEVPSRGEAWWTDDNGNVRAKFFNGNLVPVIPPKGNTEATAV